MPEGSLLGCQETRTSSGSRRSSASSPDGRAGGRKSALGGPPLSFEQSTARVADLATRVYVMRNGKIVLHETKASLGDGTALTEAYFGDAGHAAEQHVH